MNTIRRMTGKDWDRALGLSELRPLIDRDLFDLLSRHKECRCASPGQVCTRPSDFWRCYDVVEVAL